ncbi:hypothetical protein [Spirosoma flavum]|uniref:Uncharacterized protein n=1 Tax=Spirosoma flavum TaxID=2048557 RepID=A0ABW6AF57_9BACT
MEDIFSPDRRYKVSFGSYEVRMSHWIDQPYLIRVSDNVSLFNLNADVWSASNVRWLDDSTVELYMRKYPGLVACTLTLNALTNHASAVNQTASFAGAFSELKIWLLSL